MEQAEFSRPVSLDRIGAKPVEYDIAATPEECEALARRFGILSVERLSARVTLAHGAGGETVQLAGRLQARVVQSCVVTLEAVSAEIDETFALIYGPGAEGADVTEIDPDPDDAPVEPLPGDAIDIGESVAQQLSLALDPYPRAPRASLEGAWPGAADSQNPPRGPLSALESLKIPGKPRRS